MSLQTGTVKWYSTLAFKLFALVSAILFVAIFSVTLQNSRQFRDILNRQNEENLRIASATTASSFQDNIYYWNSIATSLGHMSAQIPTPQLQAAVESLLTSNRGLVAVLIKNEGAAHQGEMVLQKMSTSEPIDSIKLNPKQLEIALTEGANNLIREQSKSTEKAYFVRIFSPGQRIPVVQIATRMKHINRNEAQKKTSGNSWIVISVWQSALAGAFLNSSDFSSALVDTKGKVILRQAGAEPRPLLAELNESDFAPFLTGKIGNRTWLMESSTREPVMVSATHIVELGLIVVTQKLNKQDALETNQQVRKTMLWGWILFLIALAVSYAAAAGLTQRIMELVKSTLQIASGNLNIQLAESANDEVGFLSRSINRMASDIQVLLHVREIAVRQHTELKMAENIQKMLIPETQTQRAGITTQAFLKSATECAGDWWGRFSFGEKKEMIVLADATGHGAHAAIIVSLAYSYFSTLEIQMREGKQVDSSPLQVAKELNAVLFSAGHGQSTMTVFILLFDLEEQKVHALSAGHCMPFMLIENTSNVIGCSGSVLGSTVNLETTIKTLDLQPEQRFLLYTDGLFECTNSDKKMIKKRLFNEKLAAWNKHSLEILSKNVFSLIEEHFEDHPLTDDITLILIEHNLQKNALSAEAKAASSELALVPEKKERLETNANTEPERQYFEDIVPRKDWQII